MLDISPMTITHGCKVSKNSQNVTFMRRGEFILLFLKGGLNSLADSSSSET